MESTRQAKISRLLQKELSEIFRAQTAKTHSVIVTVSGVRVSPDLSVAKAYLSVFPSEKAPEILESIKASERKCVSSSVKSRNCNFSLMILWIILRISTLFWASDACFQDSSQVSFGP